MEVGLRNHNQQNITFLVLQVLHGFSESVCDDDLSQPRDHFFSKYCRVTDSSELFRDVGKHRESLESLDSLNLRHHEDTRFVYSCSKRHYKRSIKWYVIASVVKQKDAFSNTKPNHSY
ncbi:unnamed protein product [Clavelina lepadiformis]|uniref:Uncharacterized protein n=1 Tax=Clavelina lepadiformis TaxID=159417 RepID=A0ABP0GRG9_CLALP